MRRSTILAAFLTMAVTAAPFAALAQTADDLKNDEKTPDNVLVYGMGYSGNRYSPLTQINKAMWASWSRRGRIRSPICRAAKAFRS